MSINKKPNSKRKNRDNVSGAYVVQNLRQNVNTEYLNSYMNKIKLDNTHDLKSAEQLKAKTSFNFKKFELNREQFLSSKYQTAMNYLRNLENHKIGFLI